MRNIVDSSLSLEDAPGGPPVPDVLKQNGEEALLPDPKPSDAERLAVQKPISRCPLRAIYGDLLDAWLNPH
jgi:hypothetical protein